MSSPPEGMRHEPVVITGVGAVTPLGNEAEGSFAKLLAGCSGVRPTSFGLHPEIASRISAEVKDFDADALMGRRTARRYARFAHLALAAAREAASASGLASSGYAPERRAVVLGVGLCGLELLQDCYRRLAQGGPRAGSPFDLPGLIPNMAAGLLAMEFDARGPSFTTGSACASGAQAIGASLEMLRRGEADQVITGGTEAVITEACIVGFERIGALSRRNDAPTAASRPFDRERDGFVLGEGAGILVLERLGAARERGATIYAELAGYGATSDAYHITRPREYGQDAARAIQTALTSARLDPADVEYVNAHGTSTLHNDVAETQAIKAAFGHHAAKLWVSSNKSMIGHLLGAAGAVEAIFTALSLRDGLVPPTQNLEDPDPQCNLDYVPKTSRERPIRAAISNSFGFGGHNVVLALRRI